LSSSKTGSTDLRDTEVQQPKVTATLSCEISCSGRSANSGQLEAGSTTTASSLTAEHAALGVDLLDAVISAVFLSAVSEMAIVPDSECSTPTLIGVLSCAKTMLEAVSPGSTTAEPAAAALMKSRRWVMRILCVFGWRRTWRGSAALTRGFATTVPPAGAARRTRRGARSHREVAPDPDQVTGLWTVTSLVPSGKVASTWMSGIISGTPSITSSRAEQRRAVVHQVGHRAPVPGALEHGRGDVRDRLRVVQLQPAGAAPLGEQRRGEDQQLVLLSGRQVHLGVRL
jgi:hypothetical protein